MYSSALVTIILVLFPVSFSSPFSIDKEVEKQFCGSWIFADHTYENPLYSFQPTTKYHQINATLDDTVGGILVREVDVLSGETIKPLFSIIIQKKTDKEIVFDIEFIENKSNFQVKLHTLEEGIQVLFIFFDFKCSLQVYRTTI